MSCKVTDCEIFFIFFCFLFVNHNINNSVIEENGSRKQIFTAETGGVNPTSANFGKKLADFTTAFYYVVEKKGKKITNNISIDVRKCLGVQGGFTVCRHVRKSKGSLSLPSLRYYLLFLVFCYCFANKDINNSWNYRQVIGLEGISFIV